MFNHLLDVTFEINLFSLVAFLSGILTGGIIFGLVYFIGCINSLKKKDKIVTKSLEGDGEKEIKEIIDKHLETYEDDRKRRGELPLETYRDEIFNMMTEIATKFYPKSKRPLLELSVDEVILLNRYILSKLEELLSHRVISLLRKVKISSILEIVDMGTKINNSQPVQYIKKNKLKTISDMLLNILGVLNPVRWIKKLVIDPSINAIVNYALKICFKYIGEQTYKVYSKQALTEIDQEVSKMLEYIDQEGKKVEKELKNIEEDPH